MLGFKKTSRVRRRADYQTAMDGGRKFVSPAFILFAYPRAEGTEANGPRLGLVVSRKVGIAVERNHIKRCLRECFRSRIAGFPVGDIDLVVLARPAAKHLDFAAICTAFTDLLRRLGQPPPSPRGRQA